MTPADSLRFGARRDEHRRAPLLVPSPQGWAGRALVRELRVLVDGDGALVVQRPGGVVERRAAPGEITRVALVDEPAGAKPPSFACGLLPANAHGLLVFVAGDRPVLALWLAQWLPTAERDLDNRAVREVSGAAAVARGLGVPLEHGDTSLGARAADVVLAAHPSLPVWARWTFGFGYVAMAAWLAAIPASAGVPPVWLGVVAAFGSVAVTLGTFVLRRQAERRLPAPPGREYTPVPGEPVSHAFRERARLYAGPKWLVLVDPAGREAWIPGPALGGVVSAAFSGEYVALDDASGTTLAGLPATWWIADSAAEQRLREILAEAGVAVRDEPPLRQVGSWMASAVHLTEFNDPMYRSLREATGTPARAGFVAGAFGAVLALAGLRLGETGMLVVGLLALVPSLAVAVPGALRRRRAAAVS